MIDVVVPRDNVNDEVVIVRQLIVKNGIEITAGQAIMEIETSKTTIEIVAPEAGTIHFLVSEGDEVPIGDVLCRIAGEGVDALDKSAVGDESDGQVSSVPSIRHVSRSAAAAAKEYGVDVSDLSGRWLSQRKVLAAANVAVEDAKPAPSPRDSAESCN